jgi:Arm DNA-binding domain
MNTINVILSLRKDFVRNNGKMTIEIRLSQNSKKITTESTGIAVLENEWIETKREIKSNNPAAKQYNLKMYRRVNELKEMFTMAQLNN